MFLFDTDILSNLMKPRPAPALLRRLAGTAPEAQFTTSITLGELVYGAERSSRRDHFLERLRTLVVPNVEVLSFDEQAAYRYGSLRAGLERKGQTLTEPDLRIAAIALCRGLTVVTGNVKHFARVDGLTVENWLL